MSREFTTRLMDLAEDGSTDWETVARVALNWMSEHEVQEMCEQSNDLEDFFPEEEEEEEEEQELDGVQYRYIVKNNTPSEFCGEVYEIQEDGTDSDKPVYTVTEAIYNDEEFTDVDFENCEETVDHYLDSVGQSFADYYLDAGDDAVFC